jgi:3-dehydroquinate synthase
MISQVDSSVGGKTGVNLPGGKNLVGTFCQPEYVHIDVEVLKTLDDREYKSGLGEIVKHAVIKGEGFLSYIEDNIEAINKKDRDVLEVLIAENVKIKGEVVEQDEKEAGLRRILNLGHTVGHGLEASFGYGIMRHGEGVSIGMIAASMVAEKLGRGSTSLTKRLKKIFEELGLPVMIPADTDLDKVMAAIYLDKKVRNKKLEFVLPEDVGRVVPGIAAEETTVNEVMKELKQ